MDGVVTRTARLHAAAWKELFDEFLRRSAPARAPIKLFDEGTDYHAYVDGKPRLEGVRSFLRARDLALPEGDEGDPADAMTMHGLARRKDAFFERRLREQGIETFASTIALIEALRQRSVKVGLVTSSRHGREIVRAAGLGDLFDTVLDGVDLEVRGLAGKPDPDMFVECAEALGASPDRALVFEDALSGVQAGRRGGFGLVVGLDRGGNGAALTRAGADVVVTDLAELGPDRLNSLFRARQEEIAWCVEAEGFDPSREDAMESLFAVGNGYLGVRGSLDTPLPGSHSDLFIAGIYDRKDEPIAYSEIAMLAPERPGNPYTQLEPLPFPFQVTGSVEGEPLELPGPSWRSLNRRLDLRRGLLEIEALYEAPDGRRTAVRSMRCASLADPHLLLHEVVVTPENHWGAVELQATLMEPDASSRRHPPTEVVEHVRSGDLELVCYTTHESKLEICIAARAALAGGGRAPVVLRRVLSVFTSRDGSDPRAAARAHVEKYAPESFDELLAAHEVEWREFWAGADIRVGGSPAAEQALRFGSYHLRIAAGDDPRVSVPARALTGRAYDGHVFWDTEIFMLPFYLHATPPQAKDVLLYRHRTLDGARRRARSLGYRGACFPWESTVTGDDVTPTQILLKSTKKTIPVFTGDQQVHVTADIAYAVWRYWESTRDEEFIAGPGAELLFETARFWTSRVTRGNRHYHIRGVVGPDEYHHDVNDNAYTNWMARFNLERAAWVANWLGRSARPRLEDDEPKRWAAVAEALFCPGPDSRGVIEQFEGFFELEEYPLSHAEPFKAPISPLFDWEKINRVKLIKQADVLMLPLLFPDGFSEDVVAANYRYYEPITDHGSSLSPPVHAAIAARLALRDDFERYWKRSLWLDLSDGMDNSALGVHPAAMGGTWQALVYGVCGVRFTEAGPIPDPRAAARLPAGWRSVAMKLAYRGRTHALTVAEGASR